MYRQIITDYGGIQGSALPAPADTEPPKQTSDLLPNTTNRDNLGGWTPHKVINVLDSID